MKKKYILTTIIALILAHLSATACTTAVLSGKYTADGRPMIWKIRDTEEYLNYVKSFKGQKHTYIGIINTTDTAATQIWGGHNDAAFAIMNSASFNVNLDDKSKIKDKEGYIMKRALEICSTLSDFEAMLDTLKKPMGIAAHFGVIDAQGGAAFYEVNNHTWTKFDANKTKEGYIIRTNFSETGKTDTGYGYIRKCTAQELFLQYKPGEITTADLTSTLSRSMYNSLLQSDLSLTYNPLKKTPQYICTSDLITRYDTSSMILVQGVAKGDDSELCTSWIQIGLPYISAAIPVWTWDTVPEELGFKNLNHKMIFAQTCSQLKEKLFPLKTIEKTRYMRIDLLIDKEGKGWMQQITELEKKYIKKITDCNYTKNNTVRKLQLMQRIRTQYINDLTVYYNQILRHSVY